MKKNIYHLLALAAITLFASCSSNNELNNIIESNHVTLFSQNSIYPEVAFPESKSEIIEINENIVVEKVDSFYIWEGDIILSPEQISLFKSSTGLDRSAVLNNPIKYWPNRKVYYSFASNFTKQASVLSAIAEWESKTSLKFIPKNSNTKSHIEFIHDEGNYSSLGMIGGKQVISIDKVLSNTGTVIHEIGHAIGLYHEHTREDRDNYIRVLFDNIKSNKKHNFEKYGKRNGYDIGPFDFNSIMMYSSYFFNIDESKPTIVLLNGDTFNSQRYMLSPGDIEGVNSIYGPPYNKLVISLEVLEDNYGQDWSSYYSKTENAIYFYEDENCTIRTKLKHPRAIGYTVHRTSGTGANSNSTTYHTIQAPAGSEFIQLPETYSDIRYDYGNLVYNETTIISL